MIVLGTGGHTAEMLEMIGCALSDHRFEQSYQRVYVIGSSDNLSEKKI